MFLRKSSPCVVGVLVSCVLSVNSERPVRADVVINEVLSGNRFTNVDEDGDNPDWLELHNAGSSVADLTDFSLTDNRGDLRQWVFPETTIAPGGYLLVWCSGKDRIAVDPERLTERNSPLPFTSTLVDLDRPWAFLTGAPDEEGPPPNWMQPDFDDSTWDRGVAGFGFGRNPAIRTELPTDHAAVFLRTRFEFEPGQRNLVLQIRFDDGFVAYLNGERVASDNFPENADPTFASQAERSNSANSVDRFDLTPWLDSLKVGENVLAIAVLNQRPTSTDLVAAPELGTVPPTLHTNFRIRSEGESIVLVDSEGDTADAVTVPPLAEDQSFARSPDGRGPFLYHRLPTPLAANEGPASEKPLLVDDIRFSVDRGFYEDPFEVEITTATEGAQILYTLDGSEPGEENGTRYTAPIRVEGTTTLRARAIKPEHTPGKVDTQTYIFVDDIVQQSTQTAQQRGLPSRWGTTAADYAMDSDVVGPNDRFGGIYAATIRDDLKSLPTMSIVLSADDMFGQQGIYSRPTSEGVAFERPCSVELISADGGDEFQINCGIRIQGGYFRQASATPKHSLRLLFKADYGPTKLEFPLFGEGAADRFDTITLRAGANDGYSWNGARLTEQYTRDEFGRSLQIATGNAGSHGLFVHLYINGVYWGLYNPSERPDNSFSATYYGGEKEDWDAVHDLMAMNGTSLAAWNETRQQAQAARTSLAEFQALQGRNPDGTPNPELPHLLDVTNYIDYLIVNLWGGNWDWPWKNWWAGRDRTSKSTGYKFYCWDFENTIGNNRSRSPLSKNALQNNFSQAGEFHTSLRSNPEYRQLFGDRVHRFFSDGGILTPESLIPRYEAIASRVERAMVAESARWGDQHFNPPLTLREWEIERQWVLRTYLPARSGVVLGQFVAAGLYPRVETPILSRRGGLVPARFLVHLRAPEGVAYYTLDGSDPRLPGGDISPSARVADAGEPATLVPASALARLHVPLDDSLGLGWTEVEFDDSAWVDAPLGVGFETETGYEEFIATDLTELLFEKSSSVYLRISFEVEDPAAFSFLALGVRYDDGYIAYINGVRVADGNAPADAGFDSTSTRAHSDRLAVEFEARDIGIASELLRPGTNVIALHGLNRRADDGDFLIDAQVVGTRTSGEGIVIERSARLRSRSLLDGDWSALDEAEFVVDSNIPLRISELMYRPLEPIAGSRYSSDDLEFIEFLNVGLEPIDLSEIRLRGGVQFDFAASSVDILEPAATVLVVKNGRAFTSIHDTSHLEIAGEYSGSLSDTGEVLTVEGFLGEPILELEYDAEWYPETNGAGRSLVFIDPTLPREAWSVAENWQPSQTIGGTPGTADPGAVELGGSQRPGDLSQDGRLNITDAIYLLRFLFAEASFPLPCDGETIAAGANRTLADLNGDAAADPSDAVFVIEYLFLRGEAPALGTECVRIRGCADACGR